MESSVTLRVTSTVTNATSGTTSARTIVGNASSRSVAIDGLLGSVPEVFATPTVADDPFGYGSTADPDFSHPQPVSETNRHRGGRISLRGHRGRRARHRHRALQRRRLRRGVPPPRRAPSSGSPNVCCGSAPWPRRWCRRSSSASGSTLSASTRHADRCGRSCSWMPTRAASTASVPTRAARSARSVRARRARRRLRPRPRGARPGDRRAGARRADDAVRCRASQRSSSRTSAATPTARWLASSRSLKAPSRAGFVPG